MSPARRKTGEQTQNNWRCSSLVPDWRQAKADADRVSPSSIQFSGYIPNMVNRSGFIKQALSRIHADAPPGRGGVGLLASAVTAAIPGSRSDAAPDHHRY